MQLSLIRNKIGDTGAFGQLLQGSSLIAYTLEHAYLQDDGSLSPKLPEGTYSCQRGLHQLEGMSSYFSTFEIMNVPNHFGILFHIGNAQGDSSGCVLLGSAINGNMLVNSRIAFAKFMSLLSTQNSFILIVNNQLS
jgi:Family of unknown function (DUF5675)